MERMYNVCSDCGCPEQRIMQDPECKVSEAGGPRLVCIQCKKHTAPQRWNEFNPVGG